MKRISFLLTLMLLVCAIFPLSAAAQDIEKGFPPDTTIELTAQGILLLNLDTGETLYEKNADLPLYPASVTKIMTAIIALENTGNINTEKVTYPIQVQNYLYEYQMEHGAVSSGMLLAGEELTMKEYLYAAMLPSANESAMTIAYHISGSEAAFAKLMTSRAAELGATNTTFVNATGLFDEQQVTTARDLSILTQHALTLDGFEEIVSTPYYKVEAGDKNDAHSWNSTIDMQKPDNALYYPGLTGVKTGTLPESGRCFVSTVEKNGYRYLLVLLGCELTYDDYGNMTAENQAFTETKEIYDWVFNEFRTQTLVEDGFPVGSIKVNLSSEMDTMQVITNGFFSAHMPRSIDLTGEGDQFKKVLDIPEVIDAPVKKGQPLGEYILLLNGEEIGRLPVVAGSSVEASRSLLFLQWVKSFPQKFMFKFVVIFLGILLLCYTGIMLLRNRNLKKQKNRRRPPRY